MILLFNLHSSLFDFGHVASAIITEGPEGGSFPRGTNIVLKCKAQEQKIEILWLDKFEDTVIFINKQKNTEREKFENFLISEVDGDFTMTIMDAQVSDDGYYSCKEGDDSRDADIIIEEAPVLLIKITTTSEVQMGRSTKAFVPVLVGELIIIQCKAEKAKPAVHLQLKVDDSMWIEPINHTQRRDSVFFVTEAFYSYVVEENDLQITC